MASSPALRNPAHLILTIRQFRVMLDADLAALYGVSTGNLNKAVRRNLDRFPEDFMFQLSAGEAEALRFQSGTSNKGRGGRRYLPYAFTQERRRHAFQCSSKSASRIRQHRHYAGLHAPARNDTLRRGTFTQGRFPGTWF
ncbi:MAG: ORF6N domain-containing protein [Methylacidiphilales bacterium]|nr:ORF6N domain-containing protein [Candidatus Methylacidiphilales bacterium]